MRSPMARSSGAPPCNRWRTLPTSNTLSRAIGSAKTATCQNEKFVAYAQPLILGEVKPPVEGGLPKYVVLEKTKAEKKLPPRAG